MRCAFLDRECASDCVARVPVEGGDPREGYHFTFVCARVDAMYAIAAALTHINEEIVGGLTIINMEG